MLNMKKVVDEAIHTCHLQWVSLVSYPSIHLSIHPSIFPSMYSYVYLFLSSFLSHHLFIHLFYLSHHQSICPSYHLSILSLIHLSNYSFIQLSVHQSFIYTTTSNHQSITHINPPVVSRWTTV